ncbi:toxin co-regulated pilus biosynthesis Q family protein [Variovorax sp. LjRoot178]|uniref:toxin co-regulated pilus biosynthesis Q family protein n=1 Tax=Variovorax sp. LjRoot178 TaxID=3342277 RepID=UPI003ED170D6
MFKNAPRRASALANSSAPRAALLALVLGVSAGNALAGFVDSRPAPAPVAPVAAAGAGASAEGGAVATPVGGEVAAPAAPPAPVAQHFTISRSDRTIREALVSWSKRAGWTHDAEHWTVPFDLPVLSSADLGADFKGAVRALLSSTDLTNMPLQPCFYSNKVLRVVPKAELCDRTGN